MSERATLRRLLTMDAAAEYLSMSKGFVEKEVREGRLKQLHLGRVRRIDIRELDRYIESQGVVETVGGISHHDSTPPPDHFTEARENIGEERW